MDGVLRAWIIRRVHDVRVTTSQADRVYVT